MLVAVGDCEKRKFFLFRLFFALNSSLYIFFFPLNTTLMREDKFSERVKVNWMVWMGRKRVAAVVIFVFRKKSSFSGFGNFRKRFCVSELAWLHEKISCQCINGEGRKLVFNARNYIIENLHDLRLHAPLPQFFFSRTNSATHFLQTNFGIILFNFFKNFMHFSKGYFIDW
jgi:hypothetical protein